MTKVVTIPALGDNYIYLHPCGDGRAFAVDPGDARAVLDALSRHCLSLAAVVLTHHHWDHVGGAAELRSKTGCEVIGADSRLIPALDRTVAGGDRFDLCGATVEVIATPGHTRTGVCYHVAAQGEGDHDVVYTGDTLFVGGCGRLLECDAATMWQSLQRLLALPDDTLVYCGHDYTLENCEFALTIDPDNHRFRERLAEVQKAVEYGRPTVPSTIAQERVANVFLRVDDSRVRAALNMAGAGPEEVFAELRRRKDRFG